jgi:DNA-binding winged helix-turn-helix (wHTH) protein
LEPVQQEFWEFGSFRFYPASGALYCDNKVTHLTGIPRKLLVYLLSAWPAHSDWRVLVREVWQERSKSDATVRGAIKQLRDALEPEQDIIENGRDGYFLAGEPKYFTPDGIELVAFPGGPKVKFSRLSLALSTAIQEMTTRGWGARTIEWVMLAMEQFRVESKEVLLYSWVFHFVRGEFHKARSVAERSLEFATAKSADPLQKRAAQTALGVTLTHLGLLREASECLEQVFRELPLSQEIFEVDHYVVEAGTAAFCQDALLAWLRGYPDRALAKLSLARERATRFRHPQSYCFTLVYSAWVHQLRRDAPTTLNYSDEAISIATKYSLGQLHPWGLMMNGWAMVQVGEKNAGIKLMRKSLERQKEIQSLVARTSFLVMLAEAVQHDRSEALELLAEAVASSSASGECFFLPEIYRIRGEILRSEDAVEAAACFQDASSVADHQDSRSLLLRSQMAMVRLSVSLRSQLSREYLDVLRALDKTYTSFSEGHDTTDLLEARRILGKSGS